MSVSVEKQAISIEFFEQICADEKLLTLIDCLWGCGNGMFSWFVAEPPMPSPIAEFKQDYYATDGVIVDDPFESGEELERYCTLLEQQLEQLKLDNPLLVQRNVFLERTHESICQALEKEIELKFPALDPTAFADAAVWGGESIKPNLDLLYLSPQQVRTIAQILDQIDTDELSRHFDTSEYEEPDYWLEEFYEEAEALKRCFLEAAEQQQLILSKVI